MIARSTLTLRRALGTVGMLGLMGSAILMTSLKKADTQQHASPRSSSQVSRQSKLENESTTDKFDKSSSSLPMI